MVFVAAGAAVMLLCVSAPASAKEPQFNSKNSKFLYEVFLKNPGGAPVPPKVKHQYRRKEPKNVPPNPFSKEDKDTPQHYKEYVGAQKHQRRRSEARDPELKRTRQDARHARDKHERRLAGNAKKGKMLDERRRDEKQKKLFGRALRENSKDMHWMRGDGPLPWEKDRQPGRAQKLAGVLKALHLKGGQRAAALGSSLKSASTTFARSANGLGQSAMRAMSSLGARLPTGPLRRGR